MSIEDFFRALHGGSEKASKNLQHSLAIGKKGGQARKGKVAGKVDAVKEEVRTAVDKALTPAEEVDRQAVMREVIGGLNEGDSYIFKLGVRPEPNSNLVRIQLPKLEMDRLVATNPALALELSNNQMLFEPGVAMRILGDAYNSKGLKEAGKNIMYPNTYHVKKTLDKPATLLKGVVATGAGLVGGGKIANETIKNWPKGEAPTGRGPVIDYGPKVDNSQSDSTGTSLDPSYKKDPKLEYSPELEQAVQEAKVPVPERISMPKRTIAQPDATEVMLPMRDQIRADGMMRIPGGKDPGAIMQGSSTNSYADQFENSPANKIYTAANEGAKSTFDMVVKPEDVENARNFYEDLGTKPGMAPIAALGSTLAGPAFDFYREAQTDPLNLVGGQILKGPKLAGEALGWLPKNFYRAKIAAATTPAEKEAIVKMISEDIAQHRKETRVLRDLRRDGGSKIPTRSGVLPKDANGVLPHVSVYTDLYAPRWKGPGISGGGHNELSASDEVAAARVLGTGETYGAYRHMKGTVGPGSPTNDFANLLPTYSYGLRKELTNTGLQKDLAEQKLADKLPDAWAADWSRVNAMWNATMDDKNLDFLHLPDNAEDLMLMYVDETPVGLRRSRIVDAIMASDDPAVALAEVKGTPDWVSSTKTGKLYKKMIGVE
jgi:hypothetical protein